MTMTRRISLVRFLHKVWQYTIRANRPGITDHSNRCTAPSSSPIARLPLGGGEKSQGGAMDTVTIELAAYEFMQQMRLRADGALDVGTSPFWHGWALREAFLAGAQWQAYRIPAEGKP